MKVNDLKIKNMEKVKCYMLMEHNMKENDLKIKNEHKKYKINLFINKSNFNFDKIKNILMKNKMIKIQIRIFIIVNHKNQVSMNLLKMNKKKISNL